MQKDNLIGVLEDILVGKQRIVSHPGTGQYTATSESTSVGISACGLAALNCARIAFQYQDAAKRDPCSLCQQEQRKHDKLGRCLLDRILSPQTSDDIISICSSWTTSTHLDVDDILDLPIFGNSFELVKTTYGQTNLTDFTTLLLELSRVESDVVASVITRPPEIVLCLKISVSSRDIFVVFDSHPRPSHPLGSGFVLNSSVEATAAHLEELLSMDPSILSDPSLHWQAQLLGRFSSHILVRKFGTIYDPDIDFVLMGASTRILSLMAEVVDLKRLQLSLSTDNEYLTQRLTQLAQSRETSLKGKSRATESGSPSVSEDSRSAGRFYHSVPTRSTLRGSSPKGNSSEAAAKKLQEEFDEEDRNLAFERSDLLQKHQTFECRVCFEDLDLDHIALLDICNHTFCRNCLRQYVTVKVEDRRYPVPCPACVADSVKPTSVDEVVLLSLGISESTYEIFEELQLAAHSVVLHCRKCKETMFVDKMELQSTDIIVCPLRGCNHVWCKKCEQTIQVPGPPHSCNGSSELEHLMRARGWRHCPGCQTPVQKESGCNHMTCPSPGCNTQVSSGNFHRLRLTNLQTFLLYLWRNDNAILEAKRYSFFNKRPLSQVYFIPEYRRTLNNLAPDGDLA